MLTQPASAQTAQTDAMPPTAPDFQKRQPQSETNAIPVESKTGQDPLIKPPDLPARPPLIPIPSFGNVDQPSAESQSSTAPAHKRSLAWRARAHKLKQSSSAPQKVLTAGYDEAIMTLLSSIAQANLRVDTLNSKAGELLAVPVDPASAHKYIFVFSEMPPGTVTIKASAWSTNKNSSAVIDSVFQAIDRASIRRQP
jgi:hypothetical protein